MPDFLLDSCVLIRHLRGHQPTTDLLATLVLEGQTGVATITRTEIIEGMREHEREATMRLLDSLFAYPLDVATVDLAGEYIRRYRIQGVFAGPWRSRRCMAARGQRHTSIGTCWRTSRPLCPWSRTQRCGWRRR